MDGWAFTWSAYFLCHLLHVPMYPRMDRWMWNQHDMWVLRATSHMSQEPWPCNGKDSWLSSKGHTMAVGKAHLGSHRSSSIAWSENGPWCKTSAYFVGGKRGRIWFIIVCLKIYEFERTTWWCLSVLEFVLQSILESNCNLPWNLSY